MSIVDVTATVDSYADQSRPNAEFGDRAKLWVNGGAGSDTKYAYIFFSPPFPLGGSVLAATLRLHLAEAWGGSQTLSAKRITQSWSESRLKWSNRPSVDAAEQADVAVASLSAGAEIELDLTDMFAAVSAGSPFYGIRLELSTDSNRALVSSDDPDATLRPQLEVEWSEAPDPPTNLAPAGGRVVSVTRPRLTWQFIDNAGSVVQAESRVQTSTTGDFSSPNYDSGWVANTVAAWDLAATSFPAISDGNIRYWRVAVRDGAGLESAFSDPVSWERESKGTLTITNPAAPASNFVEETTPPITWTFSGRTQATFEVVLYRVNADGSLTQLATSGRVASTDTSWTVPAGNLRTGDTYRVRVRIWDDLDRQALSGDPDYVEATRDFTYVRSGAPSVVPALLAEPNGAAVDLTFERATAPDWYALLEDGVMVADRLDPADLLVAGDPALADPLIVNLVKNPSLESGLVVGNASHNKQAGANVAGGSTLTQTATNPIRGTKSARLSGSHDGTTTPTAFFVDYFDDQTRDVGPGYGEKGIPVVPDATYTLQVHVLIADNHASGNLSTGIVWWDAAGNFISEVASAAYANNGWKSVTAQAPPSAAYALIRPVILTGWATAGDSFDVYYDAVMFSESPAPVEYVDGDQPGCSWDGTAHASTSRQTARVNRVTNPSAEIDLTGIIGNGAGTVSRVSTFSASGGYGVKVDTPGTNTYDGMEFGQPAVSIAQATGGVTYTGVVRLRGPATGRRFELALNYFDTAGGYLTTSPATYLVATGETQVHTVTATAPADAAQIGLYIGLQTAAGAAVVDTFYADAAQIIAESSPSDYFDGDTADRPDVTVDWDGTAHASPSVRYAPGSRDHYLFKWWKAIPRIPHTYEVEAVVLDGGVLKHSDGNATDDAETDPIGIWLADPTDSLAVFVAGKEKAEMAIGETAETLARSGNRSPVRITESVEGYNGTFRGVLADTDDSTAAEKRDTFLTLKGRLAPLRLIIGDLNIPVRLEEVSAIPEPDASAGYLISFSFFQTDEFSFDVTGD